MREGLPVLVEVRRGAIVEARHRGAILAVEPDGRVVAQIGDGDLITSTRSTIKPIQAIPFITSGAADRFNITPRELAIACASHDGEPIHTETVVGLLARIGLDESALRCGVQRPYSEETARALERDGQPFTQLHNNCSGKHTGMLATAVHRGLAIADYIAPDHPVQRQIIATFARIAGLGEAPPTAIDGCSAPTFGVPLRALALAFARLANPAGAPADTLDVNVAEAAKQIIAAMIAHPELIGGTRGVLDTDLMRAARGALVSKIGAEAVYSIGVFPCERFPLGLGIAIKIEDGASRALGPTVIETLAQLGALDPSQQSELAAYHRPAVQNRRGLLVGEVRAVFDLAIAS
jgi:L-asparaginase II